MTARVVFTFIFSVALFALINVSHHYALLVVGGLTVGLTARAVYS